MATPRKSSIPQYGRIGQLKGHSESVDRIEILHNIGT